jgi:hypothetical protein
MLTWLSIAFDEFLEYALEVGAINQEQHQSYKDEALQIFLGHAQEQAERVNDHDDVIRFFKGLRSLLDEQEARIEPLQARSTNFASHDSKAAIGFTKKGFVYLKKEIAFQRVVAHYRRYGKDFFLNETALRRMLNSNGYLITNSKNPKSQTHRLSVNRESYQCLKFEEATFYRLLKGGEVDGSENEGDVPDNWSLHKNAENILGRGN